MLQLFTMLLDSAEQLPDQNQTPAGFDISSFAFFGILIIAVVVMFIFNSRSSKKKEQEAKDLMDAVKPGNKVKTIGGVCGIVVEVDNDENTIVIETGSETSGKSYIKFDKQAIYQTDAVVSKDDKKEEAPAEEAEEAQEAPAEEAAEEKAE